MQYVPHAFGWKGANVAFCLWLRTQARSPVWVMFHEVAYPIVRQQRLVLNGLGVVTRGMASLVAGAAERIFVSIPAWEPMIRRSASPGVPIEWLPVPNVIPIAGVAQVALRQRYADGRPLVGHFGTYGQLLRPLLVDALPHIVADSGANVLLLGRGSEAMVTDVRPASSGARAASACRRDPRCQRAIAAHLGMRWHVSALSRWREQPPHQRDGGARAWPCPRNDGR